MEKVTGGSAKESEARVGAKKKEKGVLAELKKAIDDCRDLLQSYERSPEPSELLLGELYGLHRNLLDRFYNAVAFEKGAARTKRKPEKPAGPAAPKGGEQGKGGP